MKTINATSIEQVLNVLVSNASENQDFDITGENEITEYDLTEESESIQWNVSFVDDKAILDC